MNRDPLTHRALELAAKGVVTRTGNYPHYRVHLRDTPVATNLRMALTTLTAARLVTWEYIGDDRKWEHAGLSLHGNIQLLRWDTALDAEIFGPPEQEPRPHPTCLDDLGFDLTELGLSPEEIRGMREGFAVLDHLREQNGPTS